MAFIVILSFNELFFNSRFEIASISARCLERGGQNCGEFSPFLEYDDDRSGDFRPLRYLPKGKTVVLGLVTTKFGQLESKDALKRRIEEAAASCVAG